MRFPRLLFVLPALLFVELGSLLKGFLDRILLPPLSLSKVVRTPMARRVKSYALAGEDISADLSLLSAHGLNT